ncbi:MAG: glycosyl transferase family 1 [Chloroflexi bacterium RBG_16_48_8]|nr:MAG: glycosyl transferase family 1 [Chloroflexi bacterium RBG_16_48_8]
MKILVALTYYRPWVSGLTIYVERLSKSLAARGHHVTILTSQFEKGLLREEVLDGVHILRVPVAFRVSKGVVMPTIGLEATRQVLHHDVISIHLPQLDAWGIALRGRLLGKPTVLTYHCDLHLPKGLINFAANHVVKVANRVAAWLSDRVVAYTEDFAVNSPFLSRYLHKLVVVSPPVEVTKPEAEALEAFTDMHVRGHTPVIGIAARLATEKGVEYLLGAMEQILVAYPRAMVLFAGQHEEVLGEAEYHNRLLPLFEKFADQWRFLGILAPDEMASFYQACDVTVLPSVNSTESFGLVQIESMICGTPVVASNLPGVRQPVMITGMGKVVPLRDSDAIAEAILEILHHPESFSGDTGMIEEQFSPMKTAERYEELFQNLLKYKGRSSKS